MKTQYIAHRINTIEQLKPLPKDCGVELDLRDCGNDLILQHDPFTGGENFEDYLRIYDHGTMILNIKSERIEHRVLDLIHKYDIDDYFFLDSTIPMINLLSNDGERNIAVRFSEIEPIESVIALKDKVRWVWVDCFTGLPISKENYYILRDQGLKLCLVSPELQGREHDIERYRDYLCENQIKFDAICTKFHNIVRWKRSGV